MARINIYDYGYEVENTKAEQYYVFMSFDDTTAISLEAEDHTDSTDAHTYLFKKFIAVNHTLANGEERGFSVPREEFDSELEYQQFYDSCKEIIQKFSAYTYRKNDLFSKSWLIKLIKEDYKKAAIQDASKEQELQTG